MAVFNGSEKHREKSRKGSIEFLLQKWTEKVRFSVFQTSEKIVKEIICFRDKRNPRTVMQ